MRRREGCQTVSRAKGDAAGLVMGTWNDGRVGTFRGILRGHADFGARVFGEKSSAPAGKFEGYEPLLVEITKFFQTGQSPMSVEHTLEIHAFMEAADDSPPPIQADAQGRYPVPGKWTEI